LQIGHVVRCCGQLPHGAFGAGHCSEDKTVNHDLRQLMFQSVENKSTHHLDSVA
jgi:hypothetical protein